MTIRQYRLKLKWSLSELARRSGLTTQTISRIEDGEAAYDFTLPGESGQRNGIRGQGLFSVDLGLGKRFTLFTMRDHPYTLQIRGEAFNVSNTVRFDPANIQAQIDTPSTFGNYTSVLGSPRVIQFTGRFEF